MTLFCHITSTVTDSLPPITVALWINRYVDKRRSFQWRRDVLLDQQTQQQSISEKEQGDDTRTVAVHTFHDSKYKGKAKKKQKQNESTQVNIIIHCS